MKTIIRTIIIVCSFLMAGTGIDGALNTQVITKDAQARIGRPGTPASVAGVARRTTRRVIRRTTVYVATLPGGCTTVVVEGATLHQCGGTYYQPYQNQYVIVEVQ
ncbi:MAG: hypothetical protein OQK71_03170 [Desulfobacter sp.]|nr:hypothetical protein [Desulfobacter sp.]